MRLDLVLTPRRAIVPATDDDAQLLRLVRPGELLPCDITKRRNARHHRKLRALIRFVADNHPKFDSCADVERFLKYRTGHCREFVTEQGCVLLEMLSTSFRDMDELAFSAWAEQARAVIFTELFPGIPEGVVDRELEEWTAWH